MDWNETLTPNLWATTATTIGIKTNLKNLLNEAEFILIYKEALSKLGLKDFTIKINNRKILSGIAEIIGKPDLIVDMTVAIDKLDKI